jgi:hypothetical protein
MKNGSHQAASERLRGREGDLESGLRANLEESLREFDWKGRKVDLQAPLILSAEETYGCVDKSTTLGGNNNSYEQRKKCFRETGSWQLRRVEAASV